MKKYYIERLNRDIFVSASLGLLNPIFLRRGVYRFEGFVPVFCRLAERSLYHSINVWRQAVDLIDSASRLELPEQGCTVMSSRSIVYEIEAYFSACKALFERKFIGNRSGDLLEKSFSEFPEFMDCLRSKFQSYEIEFKKYANKIRNHSIHVNPNMIDRGGRGFLRKGGGDSFQIIIDDLYLGSDGNPIDIFSVFMDIDVHTVNLIEVVRDIIYNFYYRKLGGKPNGIFCPVRLYGGRVGNLALERGEFKYIL